MDSRRHPGPASLRHDDAVLGIVREMIDHATRPGYAYADEFGLDLILDALDARRDGASPPR